MLGITVSVDFSDYLALTLPKNAPHFERTYVVTVPKDEKIEAICFQVEHVGICETNTFYEHGAAFNKGAAINEVLERMYAACPGSWVVLWDADILMPEHMDIGDPKIGCLYSARRRECTDLIAVKPGVAAIGANWTEYPLATDLDAEWGGWFQMFNLADPVLAEQPMYPVDWRHAGGSDTDFSKKWPAEKRIRLPFNVLHLGETRKNWCGRATRRLDGTMPENAEKNREAQQLMFAHRRHYGFDSEKIGYSPGKRY